MDRPRVGRCGKLESWSVRARSLNINPLASMAIDKYHLNLAGEYRICSELLKRGIFTTVTYGNMKSCDVIAVGENRRAALVEVKTSQSTRFVTRFY